MKALKEIHTKSIKMLFRPQLTIVNVRVSIMAGQFIKLITLSPNKGLFYRPGILGPFRCLHSQRLFHEKVLPAPTVEEIYDPVYNPQGQVNLGTGTNYLMANEVKARLDELRSGLTKSGAKDACDLKRDFSLEVAIFMTNFFKTSYPVQADQLKMTSNLTSCVDLLGTFLGKPGDVFLCPAPAYSRLFTGCTQYSGVEVLPVPLENCPERPFQLSRDILARALEKTRGEGRRVLGIILTNPHNPTGQIYSPDIISQIFKLCRQNQLELVISEVYCLSVFAKDAHFKSVLNYLMNEEGSERIHVLWGLTKSLCLTGFHCAVLHSRNQQLMAIAHGSDVFGRVLLPEQQLLGAYISDHEWIQRFLEMNHKRTSRAFARARDKLESLGVQVFPSQSGFFLFCDFRSIVKSTSVDKYIEFFNQLRRNGVYVVPFWEMRCAQPGWFRIVFTAEDQIFDEGFQRIKKTVQEWKCSG